MNNPQPRNQTQSISFCITCRNRLWQLKETLARNLENIGASNNICVADFGSTDGLSNWIWSNFENEISDKRLNYFEVKNKVRWHMARAKNLAHRISLGSYLFSLDADNWILPEDLEKIDSAKNQNTVCHQFSGVWSDGSCGRIGLPSKLFFKLGGYEESMLPMGGEDIDLLRRIAEAKIPIINIGSPQKEAIQNTDEQRLHELGKLNSPSKEAFEMINNFNLKMSTIKIDQEGPFRIGGYCSFIGKFNGQDVLIDGFNNIHLMSPS